MRACRWCVEHVVGIQIGVGPLGEDPSPANHLIVPLRDARNHHEVIIHENLFYLRARDEGVLVDERRRTRYIPLKLVYCVAVSSNYVEVIVEAQSVHSEARDVELDVEFRADYDCLIRSQSDFV